MILIASIPFTKHMHAEKHSTSEAADEVHARHSNGHGFSFRERFDSQGKYNMHNANQIL